MKISLLIIILSIILVSILTLLNHSYRQKIDQLTREKSACENKISENKTPQLSLNDIFLYGQKAKTLSTSKLGKMFFTAEKKISENDEINIVIRLVGDPETLADAADLQLDFDKETISVEEVIGGDSFPLYPRKVISNNSVIITGISSIDKNNILFGKPNTIFSTLKIIVKRKDLPDIFMNLNNSGTKIYFQAQDILDRNQNISRIDLR